MTDHNLHSSLHPPTPAGEPDDRKRQNPDQEEQDAPVASAALPHVAPTPHHDGSTSARSHHVTSSKRSSHTAPKQCLLDRWSGGASTATAPVAAPPPKRKPAPTYLADGQRNTGFLHALTRIACSEKLRVGALHDGNYCVAVDQYTVAIVDGFPKAKYHLLVLPRVPFPIGQDGTRLSASELDSLSTLLAFPYAAQVLDRIQAMAERVRTIIEIHMPHAKRDSSATDPRELVSLASAPQNGTHHLQPIAPGHAGRTWPIRMAFHSIPSMHTLHLHIHSSDLVSDRVKRPQHYLSFSPLTGFAIPLSTAAQWSRQGKTLPLTSSEYELLTKTTTYGGLPSFYDSTIVCRNLPDMKAHLLQRWLQLLDAPGIPLVVDS